MSIVGVGSRPHWTAFTREHLPVIKFKIVSYSNSEIEIMERIPTWRDIPAEKLIRLLGKKGDGFHARDICEPGWIARKFGIPLELLPVEEIMADESAGIVLRRDGKPIPYMQGVIAGDLIDSIAKGLGVKPPADAPQGYSGRRHALAVAVVKHLESESKPKTV